LLTYQTVSEGIEMNPEFVEIQPFEYQVIKGRFPNLVTYFGFKFSPALTLEIIEKIIKDLKAKKKISIIENPNELLIWQYEGKPLIALSKKENKVYTTRGTIKKFTMEYCQKQGAYVLQILRKYGYATFTQYTVKLDPYRLGRTPEERALTFQALEVLSKKKIKFPLPKPHVIGKGFHAQMKYRERRRELENSFATIICDT
jgi:hypothetical protein